MNEELLDILRKAQFEKIKGELRSFVALFDFCISNEMIVEHENEVREKCKLKIELDEQIESFISFVEEDYIY